MTPADGAPIELVLFDLGGVLADFRGAKALRDLTGADSEQEVWLRWLQSPWMRRFDAGLCTAEEFAAGAISEWHLPFGAPEFLSAFKGWLVGPYEGAEELVLRTRERVPVGCLSNMNPIHWTDGVCTWPLARHFDPSFVSCELGLVKPDREIFEHVAGAISHQPARVLFIDDNLLNVEHALSCGFCAVQASGVDGAKRALITHGVIS